MQTGLQNPTEKCRKDQQCTFHIRILPRKHKLLYWQTPVAIELTDNELEGLLAIGAAGATEEGDACCALLDVFLEARLTGYRGRDACEAFAEVEAMEQETAQPRRCGGGRTLPWLPHRAAKQNGTAAHGKPNGYSERRDKTPDGAAWLRNRLIAACRMDRHYFRPRGRMAR